MSAFMFFTQDKRASIQKELGSVENHGHLSMESPHPRRAQLGLPTAELLTFLLVRFSIALVSSKAGSEVSKRAGEMWKELDESEKAPYEKQAVKASQPHTRLPSHATEMNETASSSPVAHCLGLIRLCRGGLLCGHEEV